MSTPRSRHDILHQTSTPTKTANKQTNQTRPIERDGTTHHINPNAPVGVVFCRAPAAKAAAQSFLNGSAPKTLTIRWITSAISATTHDGILPAAPSSNSRSSGTPTPRMITPRVEENACEVTTDRVPVRNVGAMYSITRC